MSLCAAHRASAYICSLCVESGSSSNAPPRRLDSLPARGPSLGSGLVCPGLVSVPRDIPIRRLDPRRCRVRTLPVSSDLYNKLVTHTADNFIESDGTMHNMRVMHNLWVGDAGQVPSSQRTLPARLHLGRLSPTDRARFTWRLPKVGLIPSSSANCPVVRPMPLRTKPVP